MPAFLIYDRQCIGGGESNSHSSYIPMNLSDWWHFRGILIFELFARHIYFIHMATRRNAVFESTVVRITRLFTHHKIVCSLLMKDWLS